MSEGEKKKRAGIKDLVAEYGYVAVLTYLATSLVVGGIATIAIVFGFEVESTEAKAGTAFSIWLVLKATQIPRIAATAVLTPFVAQFLRRRKGEQPVEAPAEWGEDKPEASEA